MLDPHAQKLWQRYRTYLCVCEELGLTLDISRMHFDRSFFSRMQPLMEEAYAAMEALEAGVPVNRDEGRRVGHYWLRAPELAPDPQIAQAIEEMVGAVKNFAAQVHGGEVRPQRAARFTDLLLIGIGGSALGPQFVNEALGNPTTDPMVLHCMDNTDPDGIQRLLQSLQDRLDRTLCLVVSKSGITPETRNGLIIVQQAYREAGLDFARHAVSISMPGSELDRQAEEEGWLRRFWIWEWVGGRTSQTSAVGLLPAALQGFPIDALLAGAAACDRVTRQHDTRHNPAALLALMWYHATGGRGQRDMVILPYKDRLALFGRYLQQLVMESLGKGEDQDGLKVEQGITVYGHKGSTDQHAYLQQLREGVNNFFVTFIEVLEDGGPAWEVDPGVTAGDYLRAFLLGTRQALSDNQRESMTITVRRVEAWTVGALIALFERAVGFYASLVNINAYHQPGVEAGKKAAQEILALQRRVEKSLSTTARNADEVAAILESPGQAETIFKLLQFLAATGRAVPEGGSLWDPATRFRKPC